jgi:hypothetical protein
MRRNLLLVIATLACSLVLSQADEKEIQLLAQLIWGTDQDKPSKSEIQEVSPALREKLRKVFRWKNYFEVRRQTISLPKQANQRVRISPKCELEFSYTGEKCMIEVKLYGEGKLVVQKRQALIRGEPIVLAGDDKNDTAWFVIITAPKG